MKIAIPTAQGMLCNHFGHCEIFTIYDVDMDAKTILATEEKTPPPHAPGVIPKWVGEQGVNIVLAGGMGHKAIEIFQQNSVDVVTGALPASPEAIITDYLNGCLKTGANACSH
ncbi:MAG: NifB/NifX family molybdenum-iron cluster-binding protein [Desulfovibrio sp.]